MTRQSLPRWMRWLLPLYCLIACTSSRPACGYTPQSPVVQALVNRAVPLIEKELDAVVPGSGAVEMGGYAIAGLACYAHTGNPDHPVVKRAVEEIRLDLRRGIPDNGHSNYSIGIALMLLNSLDATAYTAEIRALLDITYQRQQRAGGWSYPGYKTGDTSQTQFQTMGLWMARRQGANVPLEVIDRIANWLIRTQAPDGAFGYQGADPGTFTRIAQERTTNSMGVAGSATLYVCGELLGFFDPVQEENRQNSKVAGLQLVRKKKAETIETTVEMAKWRAAVNDGDAWVSKNAGTENFFNGAVTQQYYYLYTVERYWAFRELTLATRPAEPAWYNRGVDYLRKNVDEKTGGWRAENHTAVDTAFAVLFLLRSSQKTIQRIVEAQGSLIGGKTLPDDLTKVKLDASGRIVSSDSQTSLDELLKVLEDSEESDGSMWEDLARQLARAIDEGRSREQLERLRRMVISGSFAARIAAVKALSRVRELDNAPVLIYAVTDPDNRVARAAVDGLRFISRKFDGPALSADSTLPQKKAAAKIWEAWYLGLRPDGTLIE